MSRCARVACCAALAAVLAGGLPAASAAGVPADVPAKGYDAAATTRLYASVNAHRRSLGLRALAVDDRLAAVATSWTTKMAATRTLAHNDALFTPASHQALGIETFGENVGDTWAEERIEPMFLASPHHRANIESPAWTLAGFAVVIDATGQYWITQDFGGPRAAAPAPARVSTPVVHRPVAAAVPTVRTAAPPAAVRAPIARRVAAIARPVALAVPPRAEPTPRVDRTEVAVTAAAGPAPGRSAWAAVAFLLAAAVVSGLLRLSRRARLAG
jgi:uncharacterized protein YkwD